MILSRYNLKNISEEIVSVPGEGIFELPEKVLQFGTGVLLRGLPDYFIDKANRQGIFNGRIVLVKTTTKGDASAFEKQDGLYTVCIRGIENGVKVEENIINAAVSRVLNAQNEWEKVLECAHNINMQVIVSNTTEVGIQLVNEDIRHHPPVSFPGKILSFLLERYEAFGGSTQSGMVIVPTELVTNNGTLLESIVLELAHLNGLEESFIEWLETCNHFCNSLVDRIVPGKPDAAAQQVINDQLGYTDDLLIMSEVYRLWAIEGDEAIRNVLTFAQADPGVVIEPDIDRYRELKLRLLNGTHTLSCGVAFLSGCDTVKGAMDDELLMLSYITDVMQNEIAPSIPYDIELDAAKQFGAIVLDRFRNPHIAHHWINITAQYSLKMKNRCVPMLMKYYKDTQTIPELFTFGFAAYILFMKATKKTNGKYYGAFNGEDYLITDDSAEVYYKRWQNLKPAQLVRDVINDSAFWGYTLAELPGFQSTVLEHLQSMMDKGVKETLETIHAKKELV